MPNPASATWNSLVCAAAKATALEYAVLTVVSIPVTTLSSFVNSFCICCNPLVNAITALSLTKVSCNLLLSTPNIAVAPDTTSLAPPNSVSVRNALSNPLVSLPAPLITCDASLIASRNRPACCSTLRACASNAFKEALPLSPLSFNLLISKYSDASCAVLSLSCALRDLPAKARLFIACVPTFPVSLTVVSNFSAALTLSPISFLKLSIPTISSSAIILPTSATL